MKFIYLFCEGNPLVTVGFSSIRPVTCIQCINTLRPRQNERRFADYILKCFYLNENVWIPIKISLRFVPKAPINNIPALVQIMAWHRPGDKPLSEPMVVSLLTHICIWVNLSYVWPEYLCPWPIRPYTVLDHSTKAQGGCFNIGYPSRIHLKLKYHKISFTQNIYLSCWIILKICTEHGSDTAMLCAKFQNDFITEEYITGN